LACELLFWKYQDGIYLNHHLVYEALVEQETVEVRRTSCSGYLKQNLLYFQNGKSSENSWKTLTGRCISHQYNATKHSNRLLWNRWKNHESPGRYYGGIQMSGIWPTGTAALWRNEWVKFLDLSSSTILP
jgi:hypothetical protein